MAAEAFKLDTEYAPVLKARTVVKQAEEALQLNSAALTMLQCLLKALEGPPAPALVKQ